MYSTASVQGPYAGVVRRPFKPEIPDVGTHPALEIPQAVDGTPIRVLPEIRGGAPIERANVLSSRQTIFNNVLGGRGEKLGDQFLDANVVERHGLNDYAEVAQQVGLDRVPNAVAQEAMRVVEGRATASSPRVQQVADAFRATFEDDARFYLRNGARVTVDGVYETGTGARVLRPTTRPFAPIMADEFWARFPDPQHPPTTEDFLRGLDEGLGRYFPRRMDPLATARMNPEALANAVKRANPWMDNETAVDVMRGLRARALGEPMPFAPDSPVARILRQGEYFPTHLHARTGLVLPDEILVNPKQAFAHYAQDAAREKALLTTFGPADQRMEDALAAVREAGHPDANLALQAWDSWRGRSRPPETERAVGLVGTILNNLATATLIGPQTAIKHGGQFGQLFANTSVENFAKAFVASFTRQGKVDAARLGAFTDDLIRNLATGSGEVLPTATRGNILAQQSGQLAQFVVKYSGIKSVMQTVRTMAALAVKYDLLDMQQAALQGNARSVEALTKLGLTPSSPMADVLMAATKQADLIATRASEATMPYILTTPGYRFARGLQVFAVTQAQSFEKLYAKPFLDAIRTKNFAEAADLAKRLAKLGIWMGTGGEVVADVLRFAQGRPEDRSGGSFAEFGTDLLHGRVPAMTVVKRELDNLYTSLVLGVVFHMADAAIGSGTSSDSTKMRLLQLLSGAGIGNAVDVGAATLAAGTAAFTGTPAQQKTTGQVADRTFLRRMPIAGGVVQPWVNPTEASDRRRAANAMARAMVRGDANGAQKWAGWFYQRHQKALGQAELQRAFTDQHLTMPQVQP